MKEIELRAKIVDPDAVRAKLKHIGAKMLSRHKQLDYLLDWRDERFKRTDTLLRLRFEDDRTITTFKSPRTGASRDEFETDVTDYKELLNIFAAIGIGVRFKLEKERETWILGSAHIVIDRLPELGWWCEIEVSSESDIAKISRQIGIEPNELTDVPYGRIIEEHLAKTRRVTKEFVFK